MPLPIGPRNLLPVVKFDSQGKVRDVKGRFVRRNYRGSEIVLFDVVTEMDNRAIAGAYRTAEFFADRLRQNLAGQDGRSGREYYHPAVGKYRASEPGVSVEDTEWPSEVTGELLNSISVSPSLRQVQKRGNKQVAVGSNLDYAHYLVHGTRYMMPRNFLAKQFRQDEEFLEASLVAYMTTPSGLINSEDGLSLNVRDLE